MMTTLSPLSAAVSGSAEIPVDLRAIIARMDRTLNALTEGVVWVDESGAVTWCNTIFARILGLPVFHVVGDSLLRLLPLERDGAAVHAADHPARSLFRASASEALQHSQYGFRCSGDLRTLDISASRFQIANRPATGLLVIRDITELRAAESWIDHDVRIMRLLGSVAAACNQAESGEAVLRAVLEPVCREFGFAVGHVVFCAQEGLGPAAPEHWYCSDAVRYGRFYQAAGPGTKPPVTALARTVAETRQPMVIDDIPAASAACGLRYAFAFPVLAGQRAAAVVELFAAGTPENHESLMSVAAQLGAQAGRAFERNAAEMSLIEAARQLEARVEQRTAELGRLNEDLMREVIDRKHAQAAANAATARYRMLFQSLRDVVFSLSGNWRVLSVNPAFAELTGFDAKPGMRILRLVHPEDRRFVASKLGALVEHEELPPFEFRLAHASGNYLTVECNIGVRREEEDRTIAFGVLRDISQRRAAEEQLRLRDRAIASTSEGICILDPSRAGHSILYVNSGFERLTGHAAAHAVGAPFSLLYPDGEKPPELLALLAAIGQGQESTAELRARRSDGTTFWARLAVTPVLTDLGEITHCIAVISDISRQKEAEKLKNDLVSTVSHELRTPLTGMRGMAELLLQHEFDPEKRKRFVGIILREATRLSALINDFLDIQKLQGGPASFPFSFAPLRLDALVRETLIVFEEGNPTHRFAIDCPETLPRVIADAERIRRVLMNLVSNAVKYSPQGGEVRVSVAVDGAKAVCGVHDQGIGIPEGAIPKLFEKFYRVDTAESRKIGGTGLGLAIVKEIVKAHKGAVWVESTPGKGSSFYFSLPLASAAAPEPRK